MFKYSVVFVFFLAYGVESDLTSKKEEHLDVDSITKVKNNTPLSSRPVDCADVLQMGHTGSGVYKIWPQNRLTESKSIDVYCDMETSGGGWTVLQRRGDFQRPIDYFYRDWKSYKEGFGDLQKDFWLGNDNIFALTNQKLYSARFDLESVQGSKRYAEYAELWIDDENNKYTLHVSNYSGNAGDSLTFHNNHKFSTKDQENDIHEGENCAQSYKGAWWYANCHHSNLNGLYIKGRQTIADGINWTSWRGYFESLVWSEIKIRPKNFRQFRASQITPIASTATRASQITPIASTATRAPQIAPIVSTATRHSFSLALAFLIILFTANLLHLKF